MPLLGILLLSSASTSVNAGDAFSGMYAGIAGGASFLTGSEIRDHIVSSQRAGDVFSTTGKHGISKNSFYGMVYAGYGRCLCWDNTYFGTEAFIDFANRDNDNFSSSTPGAVRGGGSYKYQSNIRIHPVSYGLDFRPGYKIADCILLYARVGVGINTLTANSQVGSPLPASDDINQLISTEYRKRTHAVLRLGLGLEQPLCECLTLRVDYIYTRLGKISVTGTSGAGVEEDGVPYRASLTHNSQFNLENHAVTLGLAWHF